MIATESITVAFGKRKLFDDVSIKFSPGNCYGLIGANGAGKSTFMKVLSGEVEANQGTVHLPKGLRMSVLKQDHFMYEEDEVLRVVLMGHTRLYEVITEKEAIYAKDDFSDEDGIRAGELEAEFAELEGWDAESNAAQLLLELGISEALHTKPMSALIDDEKIKVLLAQALFGEPDILLLDEPTNHLNVEAILWLEDFLKEFKNTVIVISHDRHFLDHVCTHIADIDYGKVQMYTGNYSFWYQSSQLALQQARDANKKKEEKVKELQEFIRRFSANAAKSKQATSRRKLLDKISLDDLKPSSRKYPHIHWEMNRDLGRDILRVNDLTLEEDGDVLFEGVSFSLSKGEKIAFVGSDTVAISALLDCLAGTRQPTYGEVRWGQTVTHGYFPKDNAQYFDTDLNLVDWLRQYADNQEEEYVRGFLGRMLFTGEESQKPARVLSGGEKVRCMFSKLQMAGPNALIMDGPTNHLDLESIQALNDSLKKFQGCFLFTSHDVQFVDTLAERIIKLTPNGIEDRYMGYEEYLEREKERLQLKN